MGVEALERRSPVGAILAIVGGLVLVASALLPWSEITSDLPAELGAASSQTFKGTDYVFGYVVLAFGILAAGAGGVLLSRASSKGRRAAAVLAIVLGSAALAIGILEMLAIADATIGQLADEIAKVSGQSPSTIEPQLKEVFEVKAAFGVYVVLAGGLLVFVGGVLGTRGSRPDALMAPPAGMASPPGMTPAAPPPTTATGFPPSAAPPSGSSERPGEAPPPTGP
jgi:hypothetical protein